MSKLYPDLVKVQSRAGTRQAANQWWADQFRDLRRAEIANELTALEIIRDFQQTLRDQAVQARDSTLVFEIDQRLTQLQTLLEAGQPPLCLLDALTAIMWTGSDTILAPADLLLIHSSYPGQPLECRCILTAYPR
ncbi:hypothetical protein [Bremerella alba]|uniref:hypothetical protein n=1 Tax=Bremerella alba TaxID=980252 RepID=UPI001A954AF2|nr:hypothetical protein [Bremerella alba]